MCPADSPLCKSQEVATFTSIHGSPVTGKAPKRCPGATERPGGLVLTLLCTFWELGRLVGLEKPSTRSNNLSGKFGDLSSGVHRVSVSCFYS